MFGFDVINADFLTLPVTLGFFNLHLFIGSESLINVKFYFIKHINLQRLLPI